MVVERLEIIAEGIHNGHIILLSREGKVYGPLDLYAALNPYLHNESFRFYELKHLGYKSRVWEFKGGLSEEEFTKERGETKRQD